MPRVAVRHLIQVTRDQLAARTARVADHLARMREQHPRLKPDFELGAETLIDYLRTHRTKYQRHVGAHFLTELHKAGPQVFRAFVQKHSRHGWHFVLAQEEIAALRRALDITSAHTRISHLRFTTNIVDQVLNRRQFFRMLGLGAAAGSAGILLGLGQLFFVAKEATRDALQGFFGLDIGRAETENARFVALAREITEGAVTAEGTLDADTVASRIEVLVRSLEQAGSSDVALRYLNHDLVWVLGVLSGILLLVLGRGLFHLIMEGMGGAVTKIDALVADMDAFANWQLGRTARPPAVRRMPGDIILPHALGLLDPDQDDPLLGARLR